MIDTGIARTGIMVDRQSCRNINTTNTTIPSLQRVIITSWIETFTTETDSKGIIIGNITRKCFA